MDFGVVNTTLQSIAKVINQIKTVTNYYNTKSLTDITKLTRVEPLTIVSRDCMNLEYLPDINQSLLSIFSGYYLQAVSILTRVQDVEVVRILDKLNPDRDETGFLLSEEISREAICHSIEEFYKHSLPFKSKISIEDIKDDKQGDSIKLLNEMSSLSVGKVLNVTISVCDEEAKTSKTVTLPVNVRLLVSIIPNNTISHLIAYKTEDNSLTERWHAWRSGRISFIRDLIFCQDLITENKKAMINDESGTMYEIMRRVNNAKKFGLLSKNPSLVSASNLFIISEEIAKEIEVKLGGKLSNPKIREKAFENTYAMILVVVDREREIVTFYSRGITAGAEFTVRELKNASKGKGPDIMDILKSFNMGSPVTF